MRIRIEFHKTEAIRFIGHLDLHKTWERIFRRAGLPLAYSKGFHPQPRLNLACALPVAFTSECELLDAWLEQQVPINDIYAKIIKSIPQGLTVKGITHVELYEPSMQSQVESVIYKVTIAYLIPDLENRIENLLKAESIPRVRRGKHYDLKPLIQNMVRDSNDELNRSGFTIQLSAIERATGRPEEVLDELHIPYEDSRIHRIKLLMKDKSSATS